VFASGGWAPTVRDGAFHHEFSAPSAGPPPWYVYEFTPHTVFGQATAEPYGATRWRLYPFRRKTSHQNQKEAKIAGANK